MYFECFSAVEFWYSRTGCFTCDVGSVCRQVLKLLKIPCKLKLSVKDFLQLDNIAKSFSRVQVRPIAEDEMFRVLRTGKRKSRSLPVSLQFVLSECYLFVVVSPSIRSKFTCRLSVFLVYSHAYQRCSVKLFLSSLIFTHKRIAFECKFIGVL